MTRLHNRGDFIARKRRAPRLRWWTLWAALLPALMVAAFAASGLGEVYENQLGVPALYLLRGERPAPESIAVAALDDELLDTLRFEALRSDSPSAFARCVTEVSAGLLRVARVIEEAPRALHGCLIDALADAGARRIILDVHFGTPGVAEDDARLVAAMERAREIFLLERLQQVEGAWVLRGPDKRFADVAAGSGPFLVEARGGTALSYVGRPPAHPEATPLPVQALGAPAPGMGPSILLDLYGPAGTFQTVWIRDLLDFGRGFSSFSDKIVLVGAVEKRHGARDYFRTAWPSLSAGRVAGVELLATAYANLAEGRAPRRWSSGGAAVITGAIVLAMSLAAGAAGAFAAVGVGAVWLAVSAWAFSAAAIWPPVAAPLFAGLPIIVALHAIRRHAALRAGLARLAPAQILPTLIEGRRAPVGAGEDAAALLFDIVGSTNYGERYGAERLITRVAAVYEAAQRHVETNGGAIVKFTGDGGLAIFPRRALGRSYAEAACRAAFALAAEAAERPAADAPTSRVAQQEEPALRLRIGVDSGPVVLGYVGGERRGAVDAIGDPINTAARLEAFCKEAAPEATVSVAVGDSVMRRLPAGAFPLRDVGPHILRGKHDPVRIHLAQFPPLPED